MITPILTTDFTHKIYNCGEALENTFVAYHGHVVTLIDNLSNCKTADVALIIATFITIPFLYSILGTGFLIGQILQAVTITYLKATISELRKNALPGWQKKAMNLLRKSRSDKHTQELRRLRVMGVLTIDAESQLENAIRSVQNSASNRLQFDKVKVVMAQALEVRWIYGKDHDVFLHAQATRMMGLNILIKALEKAFNPENDLKHFKFLRTPGNVQQLGRTSAYWKAFRNSFLGEEKITNVREYINSKWYVRDTDDETRENLLSADGFFFNAQRWESSLFFLVNNSNICSDFNQVKDLYKKIIRFYRPNMNCVNLENLANRIFKAVYKSNAECGNLFTICIPKTNSSDIQYRSHPYGTVCNCHSNERDSSILAKLQSNVFNDSTKCDEKISACAIPQFRIYTPMLNPNTTPIYFSTPFNKSDTKKMKANVKTLAVEIYRSGFSTIELAKIDAEKAERDKKREMNAKLEAVHAELLIA